MGAPSERASVLRAAWLLIGLHTLGVLFAIFGMRGGTPSVPLEARALYLRGHPLGWSLGWLTWIFCGFAFFAFVAKVSRYLASTTRRAVVISLAAVAVGIDLSCDALYLVLLPRVASRAAVDESSFLLLERALGVVSTIAANGLYTLTTALVTLFLIRPVSLPRTARILGLITVLSATGIILAGLTGDPLTLELSTGPTVIGLCLWALSIARHLAKHSEAAS